MKKITLISIVILMVLSVYAVGAYAGSLEPSDPPSSTMHTLDEIYDKVRVNRTIVSAYAYHNIGEPNPGSEFLMTVPNNKIFVLTDCFGITHLNNTFYILEKIGENSTIKVGFAAKHNGDTAIIDHHLESGIPFEPNSEIFVDSIGVTNHISISGYLIDIE